ncbi:MAG: hypothetical protein QG614_340 [Patescibacteria group bacterium]|nr:hypothetical protein [Patescibacteria group bacterium]
MEKELIKKLDVPYHSQFLEVEDYFWNIRSCGGSCMKMCLDYFFEKENKSFEKSIKDIMEEAGEGGGYDMQNGFVHDFAVKYFESNNLQSHRVEIDKSVTNEKELEDKKLEILEEVLVSLDQDNPVMVSIVKHTLEQNKFHIILLVGYRYELDMNSNRSITSIIYHEPESTDLVKGAYRECSLDIFLENWRGKAIFVSR